MEYVPPAFEPPYRVMLFAAAAHGWYQAAEDERKRISRELHDVIAQTLTGINIRLAALKKEAALNTKGLDRNIARTQR